MKLMPSGQHGRRVGAGKSEVRPGAVLDRREATGPASLTNMLRGSGLVGRLALLCTLWSSKAVRQRKEVRQLHICALYREPTLKTGS